MFGLAPLKPHRFRRFGIRLPYQGTLFDDLEDLRLTPPTLGSCEISRPLRDNVSLNQSVASLAAVLTLD